MGLGNARTVRSVSNQADCVFCGIVAGAIPATTIARSDRAIAFMDINPVTPGHALVVPRAHATDLHDVTAEDLAACIHLAQEIAGRTKDRLGADGVNLQNCNGAAGWQSVFHFHVHVIPRFENQPGKDAIRLLWSSVPGDLDEIRRIGARLS